MKGKILVALKTKYKTFGFGDKAFDGVADYLSKTVTEESQIETAISGVEGLLKAFQGDIDTVRNEKSGLQKQLDELKTKIENPNPNLKPKEKKDDVPAWAQALIDSNKSLLTEVSTLKQEKLQATRQEQIMAKAKEYGIPKNYAKRCAIKDDEDLDVYFKDLKQEFANDGFEGVTPPESAETKIEKENESIASMINEGTKTIVESKN
jgi:septal ring factor EnvC (AmiA/AmiB activator)